MNVFQLCSEFKDREQFQRTTWYHGIGVEMLFQRPKKFRISQLQIDPEVDAIMPSLETVEQQVIKSETRNQPKKKRFLTPGPPRKAITTDEDKPKKKKSTVCIFWR